MVSLGPVPVERPERLQSLRTLGYDVEVVNEISDPNVRVTVSKQGLAFSFSLAPWSYEEWKHGHDVLVSELYVSHEDDTPEDVMNLHRRIIGVSTMPMPPESPNSSGTMSANDLFEVIERDVQETVQRRLAEMVNRPVRDFMTFTDSTIRVTVPARSEPIPLVITPSAEPKALPDFKPGRLIDLD